MINSHRFLSVDIGIVKPEKHEFYQCKSAMCLIISTEYVSNQTSSNVHTHHDKRIMTTENVLFNFASV